MHIYVHTHMIKYTETSVTTASAATSPRVYVHVIFAFVGVYVCRVHLIEYVYAYVHTVYLIVCRATASAAAPANNPRQRPTLGSWGGAISCK